MISQKWGFSRTHLDEYSARSHELAAKAQDDGTADKHDNVLKLGFNLALAKVRRGRSICSDPTIFEMFDAFRAANPDHAWVYQLLGAWKWDCDDDFDTGFALYKKSCALGHQPACEQVAYTESCRCQDHKRQPAGDAAVLHPSPQRGEGGAP